MDFKKILERIEDDVRRQNAKPNIIEVEKKDGVIWHYTSMEAFLNILKYGTLRFSKAISLNDIEETEWLERLRNNLGTEGLSPDEISNQSNIFFDWKMPHDASTTLFMDSDFISCFSHNPDKLSQWLNYGDDGRGIAFGLNKQQLIDNLNQNYQFESNSELIAGDVKYYSINAKILKVWCDGEKWISETYSNIEDNKKRNFFTRVSFRFFIKNTAFREEEEFRILYFGDKQRENKQFRTTLDGRIVPFYDLNITNKDKSIPLSDIILGPKHPNTRHDVEDLLRHYGLEDVEIKHSSATYR